MTVLDDLQKLLHRDVSIVEWDRNGLVALEKPWGVLSHPNGAGDRERSLFRCPYDFGEQRYVCGDGDGIYLLNRLDSPVSGLVLVGLTREVALAVKESFANKKVAKKYVALAKGFPRQRKGVWRSRLSRDVVGKSVKVSTGSGVFAETDYEVVESFRSCAVTLSILILFPRTGRTHQLRVHCSQNGLPIVGDQTYGDPNFNGTFLKNFGCPRLFLHSEKVSLPYEMDGQCFEFGATSPVKFLNSLQNFKNKWRSVSPFAS